MIGNPVCLAPTGDVCGEGIVWHAAHRAVYWADINRFLIHRLNLADSCVRTWLFEEPVTALSLTDSDDVLAVVLGSRVILWEPFTEVRRDSLFHLDGWPTVRLNDARSDPRGSLWVGSMRNNVNADGSAGEVGGRDGVLIRLDPDGRHTCYRERMEFPTLWLGVRIGTTFTSGTRSQTSFGSTTTIHRPVQFPTNILFSKASAAGYLTARLSIRKAIFGIAGSMETVLCGLLPMEKLIAWWKCP